jgi:Tol biopolymer transport system component
LKRIAVYTFILFTSLLKAQFNYGHQMDFGKNRLQYKDFVWTYLDYERYRVYSYQGGIEISKYVSVSFAKQLSVLEKRLDYQYDDKINILVFNNQGDFKQSNLGLSNSEDQTNIGGVTRIIGDKVNLYFNGSLSELDQQIRATLAELMITKILYGGNAREVVRNSALLNIPVWFSQGLVKYLSEGWTSYNDNILYDDIKNNNFSSFNKLSGRQAEQTGHALWYYITSTFGDAMIPNLLYMTRVSKSPENAFIYTLGVTLPNIIYDFTESYERHLYALRDSARRSPINNNSVLKKYKSVHHFSQLKVSPDGNQVVYARTQLNQLRVYLKTMDTGKETRLLKYGAKVEGLPDYNYPLLAWHPNGNLVAMIYSRKDQLIIHTRDLTTNEVVKRPLPYFDKINSFAYSNDGKRIVLSAVKKGKGHSDIFVFGLNTSAIEQLTNDSWDDDNPVFVRGSKQIVFESNRMNDTIKANEDALYFTRQNRNKDLFMAPYPFTGKVLVRISNTPEINETQAQAYTTNYISYLSDRNGIYNRYVANYDSSIAFVDTTEHYRYFFNSKVCSNYDRNLLEQSINQDATHVAQIIYSNGNEMLLVSPLEKLEETKLKPPVKTWERSYLSPAVSDPSKYIDVKPGIIDNAMPQKSSGTDKGIDFENYQFVNEKDKSNTAQNTVLVPAKKDSVQPKGKAPFRFPIQRNYYTSFYVDNIVTQIDNSFLANNYQVYAGGGVPIYLNPGFNFLTKVSISDLMEDQRITGGFRINFNLDNEILLSWEQRKRMFDHQFVFDRQSFANSAFTTKTGDNFYARINTNSFRYSIKYPFSEVAALRVSLLYRNDRYMPLSEEDFPVALTAKPNYQNLGGTRIEYIYDNTRKIMLNIFNGLRFKVWSEYWLLQGGNGRNLFTSGFDVRHYQKVHRQITWCNRIAGGNSLGTDRLIFYMGGVDNWMFPKFNDNVNVVKPEQYGFQTLATDMRGFNQNIRNGNNFVIYNSELRIPLVRYFLDHPVRSDFINNFQVLTFVDLGMAWYGKSPLTNNNVENTKTFVDNDPQLGIGNTGIIITVVDQKNPLVAGMGFGMRTRLLGYFVRLDFGWGIDNKVVQKRVIALSLTTDF